MTYFRFYGVFCVKLVGATSSESSVVFLLYTCWCNRSSYLHARLSLSAGSIHTCCLCSTRVYVLFSHFHHFLPHAVNCGRFCFWRRQSLVFLFVYEIISQKLLNGFAPNSRGTARECLVPRSDEFEGQVLKVKGQRSKSPGKRHFSALSAACVRFMFGKTSLASS